MGIETPFLPGFVDADHASRLDVDAYLARVPAHAVGKGVVAQSVLDALKVQNIATPASAAKKGYTQFRDYPLADILRVQVDGARLLYPNLPLREGLRRLGWVGLESFAATLVGRAIYGFFGTKIVSILKVANRGFEQTQNLGKVHTDVIGPNVVRLVYRDAYTFLDCHNVGIVEAALARSGVDGRVFVKLDSHSDGELLVQWQPRTNVATDGAFAP